MSIKSEYSHVNCLIGEHEFIFETLKPDQSQESREIITTSLMNGTTFSSFGAYKPMKWSATATLDVPDYDYSYYNDSFLEIESSPQEISCPAIGDLFFANVTVKRTPHHSDSCIELEISIEQVSKETDFRIDNDLFFTGERTTVFDFRAVSEEVDGE